MLISIGVFQVFLARPVSFMAHSVPGGFPSACVVFSFTFFIFLYLAGLPLCIAGSFFLERAFSLSKQTFGAWAKDEMKSSVLSLFLSVICIGFFYAAVFYFPAGWWVICSLGWISLTVVLARLMPVFVIPLFFKYLPVGDEGLKESIRLLAEKAGVDVMDVCRIDLSRKTVKANAALVGIGGARRVILADTLTDNFTSQEVTVVTAHEFGHYKGRHILKLILLTGMSAFLGFFIIYRTSGGLASLAGAKGLYDLRVLPVIFLLISLLEIAALPLRNSISRRMEREADLFALDITGDRENFISVMNKLAEMNFAERDPSRIRKVFLYSHPPINERIRFAEEWKR